MNYLKRMVLTILFSSAILLISCTKDESPTPAPDFTIQSTPTFEVVSTYSNGWIEKAITYDGSFGLKKEEFEYHENGFIRSCKTYGFKDFDYQAANHYLEREVFRDNKNQPKKSIYYNPDGSVKAEILFEDGLIKEKVVYSGDQTINYTYNAGIIHQTEIIADDQTTRIEFNQLSDARGVEVIRESNVDYVTTLPYDPVAGEGLNTTDDNSRGNRFAGEPISTNNINTAYSASVSWNYGFEAYEYAPVPMLYSKTNYFGLLNGYFSTEFDFYRQVVEQYPFFEDEFLAGKFEILSEEASFYPSITTREAVKSEIEADPTAFKMKYGDHYLHKIISGKYGFIIGTMRNLPSDFALRNQLKELAYKKANHILGSSVGLTEQEELMLSKVFFELKYFSPILGSSGVVLDTNETYETIIYEIENTDPFVLQKVYRTYDYL
ncbi:hypothetical protein SAMN05421640_2324 [Ekhidna lutea]|uniref:MORN repeat variant n=1 Tax=Ekhidna lutea TaxID=447679 RepID=A0A239JZR7_EKHLU|nr:hypothetical protein [Ekhidna lutea]SNT11109.1 hypothetical protein SAMN05421640_2324 [Ekhidna lutea]